jgi:tripartite-type tricarboxylate transporter receptor subunit TctC
VAAAPADGYTLLLGTVSTHGINPSLYKNMPTPPQGLRRDLATLDRSERAGGEQGFPGEDAGRADRVPQEESGQGLLRDAGAGTSIHLASELLKMMSGTDMTHVPYKGSAPAMMDVIGGQVQLMFDNTVTAWPQVHAGKVRALGVTTKQRLKSAPDVPAIAEVLPGFEANAWHGIFAPAGTPHRSWTSLRWRSRP